MSTISSPTYDPTSTAAALAQKYTAPLQDVLTSKTNEASGVQKGLTSLQSAIKAFQLSLTSMTSLNQTMFAQSATLSDTSIGTASATAKAAPATYSFFVEKLATASQVAYTSLSDNGVAGGSLDIMMGSSATPAVHVDLTGADTDSVAGLSVRELAAAINKASAGKLTATVITIPATPGDPSAVPPVAPTPETKQLMLTSATTGEESKITLDTSAMVASGMKTSLETLSNYKELVVAQDSVVWLGAQGTGTKVEQAANKFTAIDGVTVTLTKAQAAGAQPVTMTVGTDTDGTKKNVQAFITAYNTLKTAIDGMADPGDPENGVAAGVFAHDAGVRALRDQLVALLRPTSGALSSLSAYGITATKEGTLILDDPKLKPRLMKQLAVDSTGLDTLIGSTVAGKRSGIADKLDTLLSKWSNITGGQIKQRGDAVTKLQKDLKNRQDQLDAQYDSAYKRYLLQFTKLQELQNQMNGNASMFDALFGNKSND
jgi:flagellar hook-associated protein 2